MKALIYGAGSVGLGIASCLLKGHSVVDIIARENTVTALRKKGLFRTGLFGDFHASPQSFSAHTSLTEIPPADYDYVLVCVKSFDSLTAATDLSNHKSLLGKNAKIVLFQNGWGNAEIFASFFDSRLIYSARVITGFHRPEPNHVLITVHADPIHIGSLFAALLPDIEPLCESISAGGIPCEKTDAVDKDLWAKMLYNCALNPLSGILDVPYGKLAENEFTRSIMNGIIEEIFAVIAAAGYRTHWQRPADFLEIFYKKLVPATASHKSSTLQDLLAKKKTEIEALNGAVITLAQKHRIKTPCNSTVYNILKFIETKNQ